MSKKEKKNDSHSHYESEMFFCFLIDERAKFGKFSLGDTSELEYEINNDNKLTILKVYLKENSFWNKLFKKKFKIIFKDENSDILYESQEEFIIKKKIKFYYFFFY